jgi:hypothetical protein
MSSHEAHKAKPAAKRLAAKIALITGGREELARPSRCDLAADGARVVISCKRNRAAAYASTTGFKKSRACKPRSQKSDLWLTPLLLGFEVAGEASTEIFGLFGDAWCGNSCPPNQFGVFEKERLNAANSGVTGNVNDHFTGLCDHAICVFECASHAHGFVGRH